MARHWRGFLAAGVVALVVAVPLLYSSHRLTTLRNFRVVEDGVLYRSGQLSPAALDRVLTEYGIKTVITLRTSRDPNAPYPDAWEARVCAARGLRHERLIPQVWMADEKGEIPAEQNVHRFLALVGDRRNRPVLVHCFAGIHRTGAYCAVYRMEFEGWDNERAMAEVKALGYDNLDRELDIRGWLLGYRRGRLDLFGAK